LIILDYPINNNPALIQTATARGGAFWLLRNSLLLVDLVKMPNIIMPKAAGPKKTTPLLADKTRGMAHTCLAYSSAVLY